MKTAQIIAMQHASTSHTPEPSAIHCVLTEGNHLIGMDESMLDTWWTSLKPAQKAVLFEACHDVEPVIVPGVCRYCGCTQMRGCNPPCCWIDREQTVCSADRCVDQHEAERDGEIRDHLGLQLVPRMSPTQLTEATSILATFQQMGMNEPLLMPSKEARNAAL